MYYSFFNRKMTKRQDIFSTKIENSSPKIVDNDPDRRKFDPIFVPRTSRDSSIVHACARWIDRASIPYNRAAR